MVRRLALVLLVLAGCRGCASSGATSAGSAARSRGEEGGAIGWAPLRVEALSPGPGVARIPPVCDRAAREVCNGLDDDCSGAIDEGCGYATGQLQLTAVWSAPVDLDLYVTVPSGDMVSYLHPTTFDGGLLDRTSRGRCEGFSVSPATPDVADSGEASSEVNVENFVYASRPLDGHYVVELHYWGECMSAVGAVDAVVGVSAGGAYVGSFRVSLTPNERASVVAFDLR